MPPSTRRPALQVTGLEAATAMGDRVCMITGANSGIGKFTALALAEVGADVVMVCRDRERGEAARRELVEKSGSSSMELLVADLSLRREVRRLAADFRASHSKLHVLVNNAGSNFVGYGETDEGIERTMAVNYFAPFLLTNLLLDILIGSAPSRVVNVSSASHYGASLDLDDINGRKSGGMLGLRAYGRSKLALVLFTYELARRLEGTGVTANCLHPGVVRTNIWSHASIATPLVRFASLFMNSPRDGARTSVYLSSSPALEGVSGKYFDGMKEKRSSRASYDKAVASRLWDLSVEITGMPR